MRKTYENRVRAIRTARGMSQAELARATGLSAAHISKLEHGYHVLNQNNMSLIAPVLGVEPWELMADWKPNISKGFDAILGDDTAVHILEAKASPNAETDIFKLVKIDIDDNGRYRLNIYYRPHHQGHAPPNGRAKRSKPTSD